MSDCEFEMLDCDECERSLPEDQVIYCSCCSTHSCNDCNAEAIDEGGVDCGDKEPYACPTCFGEMEDEEEEREKEERKEEIEEREKQIEESAEKLRKYYAPRFTCRECGAENTIDDVLIVGFGVPKEYECCKCWSPKEWKRLEEEYYKQ